MGDIKNNHYLVTNFAINVTSLVAALAVNDLAIKYIDEKIPEEKRFYFNVLYIFIVITIFVIAISYMDRHYINPRGKDPKSGRKHET